MAEEYTNPSPRQELSYVSTKDNTATVLNAIGGAFNTAGSYMMQKGIKMQKEQEAADAQFINNMALKMQSDWESEFVKDGNYEEYDKRWNEHKETFTENLKKATGKDKAVDAWAKKYGDNFFKYAEYTYGQARDKSYEALNKTSVDNEMSLTANTPGSDFNGLLESGEKVYKAGLDASGINNPSNPITRQDKGSTLLATSIKDFAEKAVDGSVLNANGGRFSADEALQFFFEGGSEDNPILGYTNSKGEASYGWNCFLSYTADGFTDEYMKNPSSVDRDTYMKALEELRPKYEQAFREAYRQAKDEKLKQYDEQLGDYFKNLSLNYLLTGAAPSADEVMRSVESQGVDLSDPVAVEYLAGKIPSIKESYQEADRERNTFINNAIAAESDNITNLVGSGGGYYTPESVTVYSSGGTETLENTTSLPDNVFAFLEQSFLKSTGEGEVGIATQYGGAVEWFCDKYKITDAGEKMQVASQINKMFSSAAGGGLGSSGGSNTGGDHSGGWAIYENMYDQVSLYSNEDIQNALDGMVLKGEITTQEYQQALDEVKSRNNPIDNNQKRANSIFEEVLGSYGLDDGSFKGLIGFDYSAKKHLRTYIQNKPQATDDEIRRYCENVIAPYINENLVDEVSNVMDDSVKDLLKYDYVNINDENDTVESIWNSYMSGSLWFVNNNPSGVADLKRAISGNQFTGKKEVYDFAANTFFGGDDSNLKFDDLSEGQQSQVAQAMVIAYKEAEQYAMVKDAAMATKPAGTQDSDWCREVRFDDCSIGIMTKTGFVFRCNYDYNGNGSKTDMAIGYVGTASEDYRKVFGKDYAEYAAYYKGTSQMIGVPANMTRYNPIFRSTEKSKTQIQDRSADMAKELTEKRNSELEKRIESGEFRKLAEQIKNGEYQSTGTEETNAEPQGEKAEDTEEKGWLKKAMRSAADAIIKGLDYIDGAVDNIYEGITGKSRDGQLSKAEEKRLAKLQGMSVSQIEASLIKAARSEIDVDVKTEAAKAEGERLRQASTYTDEEMDNDIKNTFRIKKDWAVTEDDFRNDDELKSILGTLYRGYISSSWNR